MMKTKSALPWFGSDASVAADLAKLLDGCRHVTIPFCGGMGILPHLKAKAVVANDKHNDAINFYKFASGRFGEDQRLALVRKCESTLSHPEELWQAQEYLREQCLMGSLNRAWAFWAVCWIGRKGKGGTSQRGGSPSVRWTANGGNNATRLAAAASDLSLWAEQFKRCEFTDYDYVKCLSKVTDKVECGLYVDPPWFGAGDAYLHAFTDEDHEKLRDLLQNFRKARIVIRYGDCEQVRSLYDCDGFRIVNATSRTQANKSLSEVWITNT